MCYFSNGPDNFPSLHSVVIKKKNLLQNDAKVTPKAFGQNFHDAAGKANQK